MTIDTIGALKDALRSRAKSTLLHVPPFARVLRERDALREEVAQLRAMSPGTPRDDARQFVPPGHYYSPIPSLREVRGNEARIFGVPPRTLPGIELREREQVALLKSFEPFYEAQPFASERAPSRRYFFDNPAYSYSDALFLHFMIRHARPRRIVEVGSGYSSCVMLDTNELFFDGAIACAFVEPFPELLRSLLRPGDEAGIDLFRCGVQSVPLAEFERLERNDILFIDSTHVAKIGSDVNFLFFEILPRLAPGVYVHFHDIFYPFEYPREWVLEGRAWSEAYLLRALLTLSGSFDIVMFNTFLEHFHREYFEERMPLCLRNPGGSIWLRRRS
ncbi:MAG TPA: class I SAM-dependent methyltransferase [Anaeromyxobacter sp.]|jgi:hypothetical protein|nr:class I SAM-dependent methyltransferase [Anaeromyxobacter sp.]